MVASNPVLIAGRYHLHDEIAFGGMATVHVGRLVGPSGFSRTVAIKRLHTHYAKDPEFVTMFMDEALLAARIRHPNVVSIVDVLAHEGELLLVMDYIDGESLWTLLGTLRDRGERAEPRIVSKIMTDMLAGLHAAHELTDAQGKPLGLVHRDVSPQNVLVGIDGIAHLIDFGVAKAAGRLHTTQKGELRGKLAYMAPEQVFSGTVDRRTDVYAASTVLWEALVGRRLLEGEPGQLLHGVISRAARPPSELVPELGAEVDELVLKGLHKEPEQRFATAQQMADALEAVIPPASSREVALWVRENAQASLARRAKLVALVEGSSPVDARAPTADIVNSGPRRAEAADASTVRFGAPAQVVTDNAEPGSATSTLGTQAVLAPRTTSRRMRRLAFGVGIVFVASALIYLTRGRTVHVPASAASARVADPPVRGRGVDANEAPRVIGPPPKTSSTASAALPRPWAATSSVPKGAANPPIQTALQPTSPPKPASSGPPGATSEPQYTRD